MGIMKFHILTRNTSFIFFVCIREIMERKSIILEERVEKLEREVERLRRLIETHVRDHGFPPFKPDIPPKDPFRPGHPDVGPPREI